MSPLCSAANALPHVGAKTQTDWGTPNQDLEGDVEDLHEDVPHILNHPIVEDLLQESAELQWFDRPLGDLGLLARIGSEARPQR